jgi:transposase InsO family protein
MRESVCPPRRMRFSFESRCRIVQLVLAGASPQAAAAACGASRATGYRLWRRYQQGGRAALIDRPPVPIRQPRRLSAEAEAEILEARAYANAGPVVVAGLLGRPRVDRLESPSPPRTLAAAAAAAGAGAALRALATWRARPRRHQEARPLLHDRKGILADRLTRSEGAGWQYLHLAIDDHSRLAYAELLPSESNADCVAFLRRAHAWYASQGATVERVLSDNGNGYRSRAWTVACAELGVQRRYIRPRRPQTNGKAEALVKTLLREWAYRFAYPTSAHRAKALPGYLRWYNRHRPHGSLGGRPPITRVSQVCGTHS